MSHRARCDCRVFVLAAWGLVELACGRTDPSKSGDAAAADAGARDLAPTDQPSWLPDLAGSDQPDSDRVGADSPPDRAPADSPGTADVATAGDLGRPDLVRPGDEKPFEASKPDAPVAEDADAARSDAPAGDMSKADAFSGDTVALGDGRVDQVLPCGPGGGGCNDDPTVSSIWGTCLPDGTCACSPGFVINPSTGRCRPPLRDASPPDDAGALACTGEYSACGCGCCVVARNVACYYPTLGESTAAIKAEDEAAKARTNCALVGCAAGTRYVCCTPATPDPGAVYTAVSYIGDSDHIGISKTGADCAQVSLSSPAATRAGLRIDTPATWGVMFATLGACGDGGLGDSATGALGSISLRASGTECLADVHVSLFAFTSAGALKSTRLDVDGLVVKDFPTSWCK